MTKINYPASSPYYTTPQTSWNIGLYQNRAVPTSSDDEFVTIEPKYHLRPDLLSYDLYGSWRYWWVFMVRNLNVIRDPIWDFQSGTSIWIPTNATVQKLGR